MKFTVEFRSLRCASQKVEKLDRTDIQSLFRQVCYNGLTVREELQLELSDAACRAPIALLLLVTTCVLRDAFNWPLL